jgi:hypothetical protein
MGLETHLTMANSGVHSRFTAEFSKSHDSCPSTIKGPRAVEVLFGAFKKKLNSEIKVAQFSGESAKWFCRQGNMVIP